MKKVFLGFLVCSIAFVSASFAGMSRDQMISTFKKFRTLNDDFQYSVEHQKGKSGKPYAALREELEDFEENRYLPAAREAKELICKAKDQGLLKEFVAVLINNSNSADEEPSALLGDVFVCQSDLVVSVFDQLKPEEQHIVVDALEFGLDQESPSFRQNGLAKKLKSMKEKVVQE